MPDQSPLPIDMPDQLAGLRILARRYRAEDAGALHAAIEAAHQHLARWLPGFDRPLTLDDIQASIGGGDTRWTMRESFSMGLFLRSNGALLGDLRLRPASWQVPAFDIAYWLCPEAQGHGYVSEAVGLVTSLAFERLGAQRVAIACDPRNTRSARVPERLGYTLEGRLRNSAVAPDGQPCDLLIFALIPDEYKRVRAAWPGQ
jgi:RimJ/RimL family protein N-acetyltransferase